MKKAVLREYLKNREGKTEITVVMEIEEVKEAKKKVAKKVKEGK